MKILQIKNKLLILNLLIVFLFVQCGPSDEQSFDFESIDTIMAQYFELNNFRDTIIYSKQGMSIMFPANAFCHDDENSQTISIKLKEYYDKTDMVLGGLTTTSGNRILESKGMIHMEASINGKKVESLCKPIGLLFPTEGITDDYSIFNGQIEENKIDWKLANSTNHHVYVNYRIQGNLPITYDLAYNAPIIDSILWQESYSKIDTIYTFTESNDTLFSFDALMASDSTDREWAFGNDSTSVWNQTDKIFQSMQLGWINCDRFVLLENLTSLTLDTEMSGVTSLVVFREMNSILSVYGGRVTGIPIDSKVTIISFSESGNQMFIGIHDNIIVEEDMKLNITLNSITREGLQTKIAEVLQ